MEPKTLGDWKVLAKHDCRHCSSFVSYKRLLEVVNRGLMNKCPRRKIALACFEWVTPRLLSSDHRDNATIEVLTSGLVVINVEVEQIGSFALLLQCASLDSKSVRG